MRQAALEFFEWWQTGLQGLMPSRVRAHRRTQRAELVLEYLEDSFVATLPPQGAAAQNQLRSFPTDELHLLTHVIRDCRHANPSLAIVLRLDRTRTLHKQLVLPPVASEQVKSLLDFEIERQTPFLRSDVYFGFRIQPNENRKVTQTIVDLVVTPKTQLDPVLKQLTAVGIEIDAVDSVDFHWQDSGLDLLETDSKEAFSGRKVSRLWWLLLLGPLALLSICEIAQVSLDRKIETMEKTRQQYRERMVAARYARKLTDVLQKRHQFINERRKVAEAPLWLLLELTRIFPDDSWTSKIEVKGQTVSLEGESNNASNLIRVLAQSAYFVTPQFVSPVVLNQATKKERFRISVDLAEERP